MNPARVYFIDGPLDGCIKTFEDRPTYYETYRLPALNVARLEAMTRAEVVEEMTCKTVVYEPFIQLQGTSHGYPCWVYVVRNRHER